MNPIDELTKLTAMFPQASGQPLFAAVDYIAARTTPEPYLSLLNHDHHMTVTMEQQHGGPVSVQVLTERRIGDVYCRQITLKRTDDGGPNAGRTVQYGLVRFDLSHVTNAVRDQILSGEIPLGRVLINHNVMRQIDLNAILRFEVGPALAGYLDCSEGRTTYGRLATIFCDNRPAVDLLEVASPLESTDNAH